MLSLPTRRAPVMEVLSLLLLGACGQPTLSAEAQAMLDGRVVASLDTPLVYVGEVTSVAPAIDGPLYRYERRVADQRIHHITRDLNGASAVWQSVHVDTEGAPTQMELIHVQLGLVVQAEIEGVHITLHVQEGGASEEHVVLSAESEVVAGPTLFNFLLRHREQLAEGVAFDFLSLENRGVYRFEAHEIDTPGVFVVAPSDPLVALLIPPLEVVYDDETAQMVSYRGPVPPLLEDGRTFEGLVHYTATSPFR